MLGDARHFSVVFQAGSGKSCQESKACVCACSTFADECCFLKLPCKVVLGIRGVPQENKAYFSWYKEHCSLRD